MKPNEIYYRIINNQIIGSRVVRGFFGEYGFVFKCVFSPLLTAKQAPSLEKPFCPVLRVPFTLKDEWHP